MFRHELSPFLKRVLDAVGRLPDGVMVDAHYEPAPHQVTRLAAELGERDEDVRDALLGLRASFCLTEEPLEVPGIEPVYLWRVHPQVTAAGAGPVDD
jgi:hypothetical protein